LDFAARVLRPDLARQRMTSRVPIALPWYDREEYPTLRAMLDDPDNLPGTFDAWHDHAQKVERQLQATGFTVARIRIRPKAFASWCRDRGVRPDQRARLTFANEVASALHTQRPSDG
jgi:hypothetical protein